MNDPNYRQNDIFLESRSGIQSILKKVREYVGHWSRDSEVISYFILEILHSLV